MSTMKHVAVLFLACGVMLLVTGCSKKDVDENKSVEDVKNDVEKMDKKDVRAMAEKLKKEIESKTEELTKLKDKLPTDPTKLLGDDAKNLKSDIEKLEKEIDPLKEKLQVCISTLKQEGEDVSDLEIK